MQQVIIQGRGGQGAQTGVLMKLPLTRCTLGAR